MIQNENAGSRWPCQPEASRASNTSGNRKNPFFVSLLFHTFFHQQHKARAKKIYHVDVKNRSTVSCISPYQYKTFITRGCWKAASHLSKTSPGVPGDLRPIPDRCTAKEERALPRTTQIPSQMPHKKNNFLYTTRYSRRQNYQSYYTYLKRPCTAD